MPTSGFVAIGDTHIKEHIWTNRPNIKNDTLISFEQICNYCLQHNKELLLMGDVFDNPRPSSQLVLFVSRCIAKLKAAGITTYWIDGNHDKSSKSWSYVVGAENIDKTLLIDFCGPGSNLYGISYRSASDLLEEFKTIPKEADILVCHQLLDLAMPREGLYNMQADDVPGHIKRVLLGDFHEATSFSNGFAVFDYSGSSARMSMSELSAKSFISVEAGLKEPVYTRIPLTTRNIFRWSIMNEEDFDEFNSWFRNGGHISPLSSELLESIKFTDASDIQTPVFEIKFATDLPNIVGRITSTAKDEAHLFFRAIRPEFAKEKPEEEAVDVNALLTTLTEKSNVPDLLPFCKDLYGATELSGVFSTYRGKLNV